MIGRMSWSKSTVSLAGGGSLAGSISPPDAGRAGASNRSALVQALNWSVARGPPESRLGLSGGLHFPVFMRMFTRHARQVQYLIQGSTLEP